MSYNPNPSPLNPDQQPQESETSSTGFKSFWKTSSSRPDKAAAQQQQNEVTFVQQDPSGGGAKKSEYHARTQVPGLGGFRAGCADG